MGQKQCEKCGEMVGEAKAFCPACGNAFVVEEKRLESSAYDRMDSTVQFGQTMYDLMLSDMGLNISKGPEPVGKRVEVLEPAAAPAAAASPARAAEKPVEASTGSSGKKWFIMGGVVLVLGFLLAVAIAIGGYVYWTRFR